MFLAAACFLKEEQAGLSGAAVHRANFTHVSIVMSLLSIRSFLSLLALSNSYSGRAAILSQERLGTFLAPSHQRSHFDIVL